MELEKGCKPLYLVANDLEVKYLDEFLKLLPVKLNTEGQHNGVFSKIVVGLANYSNEVMYLYLDREGDRSIQYGIFGFDCLDSVSREEIQRNAEAKYLDSIVEVTDRYSKKETNNYPPNVSVKFEIESHEYTGIIGFWDYVGSHF